MTKRDERELRWNLKSPLQLYDFYCLFCEDILELDELPARFGKFVRHCSCGRAVIGEQGFDDKVPNVSTQLRFGCRGVIQANLQHPLTQREPGHHFIDSHVGTELTGVAAGFQGRAPMLALPLVDYAGQSEGRCRFHLRNAAAKIGILTRDQRRSKHGFGDFIGINGRMGHATPHLVVYLDHLIESQAIEDVLLIGEMIVNRLPYDSGGLGDIFDCRLPQSCALEALSGMEQDSLYNG